MRITARYVRPVAPPSAGGQTELMRVDYDQWVDGDVPTTDNLGATAVTGSGSVTFDDGWSVTGSGSLKVAGSAIHWFEFGNDVDGNPRVAHDEHDWSRYVRIGAPGSATAWFGGVTNGDATAWAAQIGLTSAGKLTVRDADTGTPVVGTVTYTTGQVVRIEGRLGNGVQTWAIFPDTTDSQDTANALEVITGTVTATQFLRNRVGLFNTLATGAAIGNLWHVNFDNQTGTVDAADVGATNHFGSGSLSYMSASSIEYLRINGTAFEILRKDFTGVASLYTVIELGATTAPTGANVQVFQAYDATGTTAWQVTYGTDNKLRIRNNNNGTGVNLATAANTLPAAYAARQLQISAVGTTLTCVVKNGATTVETLTCTIDDDTYTGVAVGVIGASGVTVAPDLRVSYFDVDSTSMPTGSGATTLDIRVDRDWSSSATMPAPLPVTSGPGGEFTVDSNLVPSYGCWLGSTTPFGTTAGSSLQGLTDFQTVTGSDPDIVHFYQRGAWTGSPSSGELTQINAGGRRRLVLNNWKMIAKNETYTLADIANGVLDARLRTAADGCKAYGHLMWLAPYHEYDNNFAPAHPTTQQKADYVAMFRHVVDVFRARGATNVRFVWNVTGFSTWQTDYAGLYPGDAYVDWVGIDPYAHTGDTDFASLVDGNGGYTWMTATRVGLGYAPKPVMLAEFGSDSTELSDSVRAAIFASMTSQAPGMFPMLKAAIHWNFFIKNGAGTITDDYRITSGSAAATAFGATAADPYFALDTTKAA